MKNLPYEQNVSLYETKEVDDFIAYSVDKNIGEIQISDFKAIVDAENDLVALVSPKMANELLDFFNNFKNYRTT